MTSYTVGYPGWSIQVAVVRAYPNITLMPMTPPPNGAWKGWLRFNGGFCALGVQLGGFRIPIDVIVLSICITSKGYNGFIGYPCLILTNLSSQQEMLHSGKLT